MKTHVRGDLLRLSPWHSTTTSSVLSTVVSSSMLSGQSCAVSPFGGFSTVDFATAFTIFTPDQLWTNQKIGNLTLCGFYSNKLCAHSVALHICKPVRYLISALLLLNHGCVRLTSQSSTIRSRNRKLKNNKVRYSALTRATHAANYSIKKGIWDNYFYVRGSRRWNNKYKVTGGLCNTRNRAYI